MRTLRLMLLLLAATFSFSAAAEYPDKPIRLIVPFPAGGGTDIIARIVGELMAKEMGQAIVIDTTTTGTASTAEPISRAVSQGPASWFMWSPWSA